MAEAPIMLRYSGGGDSSTVPAGTARLKGALRLDLKLGARATDAFLK